jgi:hypothetical protein
MLFKNLKFNLNLVQNLLDLEIARISRYSRNSPCRCRRWMTLGFGKPTAQLERERKQRRERLDESAATRLRRARALGNSLASSLSETVASSEITSPIYTSASPTRRSTKSAATSPVRRPVHRRTFVAKLVPCSRLSEYAGEKVLGHSTHLLLLWSYVTIQVVNISKSW